MTLRTDSATTPAPVIQLAGSWQSVSEGGQEPNIHNLAALFGWTTDVPTSLNHHGQVAAFGDEILSPYWQRANPPTPVTVTQLHAYHTYPNGATLRWFPQGDAAVALYSLNGRYAQSVLPPNTTATFNPIGRFGFNIDGESSDNTNNNQTADQNNGCPGPCGHHVLFFPVYDLAGTQVADTYYMVMDYAGINYDYNDNGYLITNVRPA